MAVTGTASLRRARRADAPVCADIAREAYTPYVPRMTTRPAPMSADYEAEIREHEVWVAIDERDVACGFLVLVPAADSLLLDNVAVRPSAQGHGVGRALLELAERRAAEIGLPEVTLYTNAVMTENQQIYTARGYVETHRAAVDGYDRVFFAKRIDTGDQ